MNYIIKNINDYKDDDVDSFYKIIHEKKKIKVDKLIHYSDKKRSIIAELILKELLNENNIDYNNCLFDITNNGKPVIKNMDIFFSISHSKNNIVVTISKNNIGIDIEEKERFNRNTIKTFTTKDELKYINKSEDNDTALIIYTLKEAYIKMMDKSIFDIKNVNIVENNSINIKNCNYKIINNNNYIISIVEEK